MVQLRATRGNGIIVGSGGGEGLGFLHRNNQLLILLFRSDQFRSLGSMIRKGRSFSSYSFIRLDPFQVATQLLLSNWTDEHFVFPVSKEGSVPLCIYVQIRLGKYNAGRECLHCDPTETLRPTSIISPSR